jgi:CRP/FNR family transcriptional regulator
VRFSKQYGVPTERGVRIELPVTHQDLANMIGTARETVSRNMARFRQQGYVKDGHAATLEILNLDSLEALIV